jgi:hypothetical protein
MIDLQREEVTFVSALQMQHLNLGRPALDPCPSAGHLTSRVHMVQQMNLSRTVRSCIYLMQPNPQKSLCQIRMRGRVALEVPPHEQIPMALPISLLYDETQHQVCSGTSVKFESELDGITWLFYNLSK